MTLEEQEKLTHEINTIIANSTYSELNNILTKMPYEFSDEKCLIRWGNNQINAYYKKISEFKNSNLSPNSIQNLEETIYKLYLIIDKGHPLSFSEFITFSLLLNALFSKPELPSSFYIEETRLSLLWQVLRERKQELLKIALADFNLDELKDLNLPDQSTIKNAILCLHKN